MFPQKQHPTFWGRVEGCVFCFVGAPQPPCQHVASFWFLLKNHQEKGHLQTNTPVYLGTHQLQRPEAAWRVELQAACANSDKAAPGSQKKPSCRTPTIFSWNSRGKKEGGQPVELGICLGPLKIMWQTCSCSPQRLSSQR